MIPFPSSPDERHSTPLYPIPYSPLIFLSIQTVIVPSGHKDNTERNIGGDRGIESGILLTALCVEPLRIGFKAVLPYSQFPYPLLPENRCRGRLSYKSILTPSAPSHGISFFNMTDPLRPAFKPNLAPFTFQSSHFYLLSDYEFQKTAVKNYKSVRPAY